MTETLVERDLRLRVTELFVSLQGESDSVGWPTLFIRLTGCPLRCTYCDTAYAFSGGQWWRIDALLAEAEYLTRALAGNARAVRHVCVTGGEPLAQKGCHALLARLCDAGYEVSLETSGALDVSGVDPRVVKVMDLKTPSSGEAVRNRYENIAQLGGRDQVKFVIGDRNDYEWAWAVAQRYALPERCTVLFSPVQGALSPRELADWILQDRLPVRFQIQLHKLLWGDEPGR